MTPALTHAMARYGGAVLTTGAAFGLWHGLCGALGTEPPPYLTFYPAVMLATTLWGWGPGILTTTLSTLLAAHWLLPPVGQFGIVSGADAVELGVFTGMGLALSVVAERYRRARNRAATYAQDLMVQAERARVAVDLDRQRQWLAVTLASIGDAVLATDPGGRLVFLNPAAEALTGWPQADALGQPIANVVRLRHAGIPAPAEDQLTLALREGRPRVVNADTGLVARDGHEIPIEGSAAPIQDASGVVGGVVVVLRDRTARQRADDALRRFELLTAHSRDIILFMRRDDGRFLEANAAAVEAYGYTREALLACTIQDLRASETRPLTVEQMTQADAHGLLFETVHRRKDGSTFPVEVSSRGATIGGLRTLVSVIRDITERKRAEEQIRTLAKFPAENPHPVLRLDRDGIILYANEVGAPLLRAWGCSAGHRAPDPWPATIRDALASSSQRSVDLACGARIYAVCVVPVPEAGYVNLYASDVTERQHAEAALQHARDTLETSVRERTAALSQAVQTLEWQADQLRTLAAERTLAEQRERRRLAGVLHDGLQQLLVAARLRAYMLGRSEDPGVQHGCREIIALIEEGLQEARTLTGALNPPGLQNGGLLAALEWLTRWMQEKHHLTVHVSPAATLSPALPEDLTVLLYQSVRELLFNVAKYARVDAAEVTVVQQTDRLTVSVADDGTGFDPTRLRVTGGTEGGFGLLGIRERLELLGGHLTVESAPGQGSRFTMVAPLLPAGAMARPLAEGS